MAFKKKERTEEEQKIYDEKQQKNKYYIYHYCLNENLPKEHPDFCFNCWIDEAHGGSKASGQQNWKYCESCIDTKNLPKYEMKDHKKGYKIHMDMIKILDEYNDNTKEIVSRRGKKLLNGHTEVDLEKVFNKYYPNVKMVKGIYKLS